MDYSGYRFVLDVIGVLSLASFACLHDSLSMMEFLFNPLYQVIALLAVESEHRRLLLFRFLIELLDVSDFLEILLPEVDHGSLFDEDRDEVTPA